MNLQTRERFIQIVIWVIIIAFVTTIFATWGAHSVMEKRNPSVAIKVDGHEISRVAYYRAESQNAERYKKMYDGEELTDTVILKYRKETADELIDNKIIEIFGDEYGIEPGEQEITQGVLGNFSDENGKFNQQAFDYYRKTKSALWWEKIESQVKENIRSYKSRLLIFDKAKTSDDELADYYAASKLQLKIQQILINPSLFIDTETAKAYYDNNKDSFVKPEKRFVRHIVISDTDLSDDTPGSLSQIKINNIYSKLLNGSSFDEMVRNSDEPYKYRNKKMYRNGDLGYILATEQELSKEIVRTAFELEKDQISQILRTADGYEIIKVTEIVNNEYYEFEKKAYDIKWRLTGDTEYNKAVSILEQVKKDIETNKISFKEAVKKYSDIETNDTAVKDGVVGFVPRINLPNNILQSEEGRSLLYQIPISYSRQGFYVVNSFSDSIFQLLPNQISDPIKSKMGVHLVKALEYKLPPQIDFELEVNDTYRDLVSFEQSVLLRNWIDSVKKNVEIEYFLGDEYFEKVSKE